MNEAFFATIEPALNRLKEIFGDEFVVFGSAPLYLLEVAASDKPINDLDIVVKDLSRMPPEAQKVTFHKFQDLYKLKIEEISVDIGSLWPGQEDFFAKIFDRPVMHKGYKFANLDVVEEWKMEMVNKYGRQKDKDYLEKIKDFKARQNKS